jgi:uncharacterized protein
VSLRLAKLRFAFALPLLLIPFLCFAQAPAEPAQAPTAASAPVAASSTAPQSALPKPRVRTVTAFINLDRSRYQVQMAETVKFLKYARTVYETRGYTVQTLRITTQPFAEYTKGMSTDDAVRFFKNLDGIAEQEHIMLCIGPAFLTNDEPDAQADLLAAILANTAHIFGSVRVTNESGVDWAAVTAAARVIKKLEETEHSEGNFHFAAIAGVPPYAPFFPGSYHTGAGHQFSVGLESADLITAVAERAPDLATARRQLIDAFYPAAFEAEDAAQRIDREQGWIYMGLDLSPAPSEKASIGAAIETLSKQPFGTSGTLSAVGVITAALREIGAKRTGFSGLMLPVLEDPILAQRWNDGLVAIDALLAYSAVCATGLDTVPLPGDTSVETIARIVGDVATLSFKWNKPLAARLLPVTGKKGGDRTEFTDPSLVNGMIRPLSSKESIQ